nr:uncharacterized mitochondrial protein AtMg00810-like [Tanacetum cinerariifolium]
IYVDDIIFGATNKDLCKSFEKMMKDKFQMSSMGEITFFLGLQVKQKKDGIFISQDKYVAEILKKFRLTKGKSASIPIDTEKPLLKDHDGEDVDVHIYRSMIGSLMYLTSSRPDNMFAVYACARFQMTPKASHLHAVKRIFRYLKGKPHLGLWNLKDSPFDLVAYSDSDYAGASLDKKSTTRGCQFLGCTLISWKCEKQTIIATSSIKGKRQLVKKSQIRLWQSNDITRIQALVDKKKVLITEAVIRDALRLDDAEGVDCLPNEVIFAELAHMGDDTAVSKDDSQDQSIPLPTPPTPPPQPPQDIPSTSQVQSPSPQLQSPTPAQPQGAGFLSRFESSADIDMEDASNQGRMIAEFDRDEGIALMDDEGAKKKAEDAQVVDDEQVKGRQADIYQIDMDHTPKVLSMQKDEPEVQEAMEVVATAKLIIEVVAAISESVSAASANIVADPEEESTAKTLDETKSKDKGKGIMVEEPKPMKKKQHVEMDEAYARKLHEELNQDIDWDVAIDHVKQKDKEDPYVQRYQTTDVTRLQALVDRKKVVVTEASIRDVLCLDDAEGVDCLPNEEIFAELARMGYENPSTKLTFYKAFFSSQWKFLIHTILQSMSAKRTFSNEFSLTMASAVICLSTGRKFNFSKYIFESLVRNVDSSSKFYMYPRFIQLIIRNQLGDLSTYTTKYTSPALIHKVFANMRRVGKGISGVKTPLFEGLLVAGVIEEEGTAKEQVQDDADDAVVQGDDVHEPSIPSPTPPPQHSQDLPSTSQVQHTPPQSPLPQSQPQPQAQPQAADFPMSLLQEAFDACAALTRRVEHLEYDKVAQALEIKKLKRRVKKLEKGNKVKVLKLRRLQKVGTSQRIDTSEDTVMEDASNQRRMIDDKDDAVVLMDDKEEEKKEEEAKEDEPAEVQEVVDVVTTAKLITEVVVAASETVTSASTTIFAAEPQVPAAAITTVASVRVTAAFTRRRKGVVIRDPEEESTTIIPADTKSKDKGKGIMVEESKPIKKKQQVEMDEEFARKLYEELNKDIDWDVAIDHVKQKAKEDPFVQRYQVMKKRPQTEAQAQKNMIMYLKNVAGFRLDYFKGMSYDDIRLIFEAKFNSNIAFLLKTKEQMEEEENRAIQSINETPAQKAAKRRKLNEEVEDLKRHLEIVPDEDDDVYTKATPLARKVLVVDYKIIHLNNKPHYKTLRADGTHQLYVSFLTLLKNFDREDLESLWSLVKERFSTSKPNNFSDDFLLTTLRAMFERPDGQDQVWKNQRTIHGQAKGKSWLLESCGVHIITFTTTQLILLVERRYPLLRFTIDQMLNAVRLRVEEQSEMSLELLRFIRQQHQEGQHE